MTADKKNRKYVAIVIYGLWQMGEGRPAVYSIIELNDNVLLFYPFLHQIKIE